MNVSKINKICTNKSLLKGLEYASEHSSVLTSGTCVLMSLFVRPLSILKTPDTPKKEKEYACAKSIASAIAGFGLTSLIFKPVSKALDTISDNPGKFLNEKTIKNLSGGASDINKSGIFNSMKQIIKISPEVISAIPKAIVTTALVVPVVNALFNHNKENNKDNKGISFKGMTNVVSRAVNNEKLQNIVIKNKDKNLVQSALFFKDILATALFAGCTMLNPKIKKEDKKPLINNSAISTALTLSAAFGVDKLTKKPTEAFMKNLIKANKNNPNLEKYLNGIKVIKPIVILSGLYYIAIPVLSTFFAGKINKSEKKS